MLGHELTHIRNGDVRMLVIAVVIAGVISLLRRAGVPPVLPGVLVAAAAGARGSDDGKGGGAGIAIVIAIALIAVAWMLSIVIRFALSRQREYLADAGSVELTKNPDAMISALRKIEGRGEMPGATSAVMEMCIDNPREGFSNIFDTHPSVDARVRGAGEIRRRPRSRPAGNRRAAGNRSRGPAGRPPAPGPWAPETPQQPPGPSGPWGPTRQ